MDNLYNKEVQLVKELRRVAGKPRLRADDVIEWAATPLEEGEGEKVYYLPDAKVYAKIEV